MARTSGILGPLSCARQCGRLAQEDSSPAWRRLFCFGGAIRASCPARRVQLLQPRLACALQSCLLLYFQVQPHGVPTILGASAWSLHRCHLASWGLAECLFAAYRGGANLGCAGPASCVPSRPCAQGLGFLGMCGLSTLPFLAVTLQLQPLGGFVWCDGCSVYRCSLPPGPPVPGDQHRCRPGAVCRVQEL